MESFLWQNQKHFDIQNLAALRGNGYGRSLGCQDQHGFVPQ
jgi:hypothetical protein